MEISRREHRRSETGQEQTPATPFRLFEDFFNEWFRGSYQPERGAGRPPVDILAKEGNLIIRADMPGISEKDIDLKLEGQTLVIKGEKKPASESEGYTYHRAESYYGSFTRSFTLPDSADLEHIKADYKNGVLSITIPQKPEVQPRSISVKF